MNTNFDQFLTPKQYVFCYEYLTDKNATRAALKAGYSSKTALSGYLMTIPKIKFYLQQQTQIMAKKAQVSHEMVLNELCKIAFGNMGNYFDTDGGIKPMQDLSADEKAALWSISVSDTCSGGTVSSTTKFRMYNKLSALKEIAKHINFYGIVEPEVEEVFVYLDKDDMSEDDSFDDDKLTDEIYKEKQRVRKAKGRKRKIEQEAENLMQETFEEQEAISLDLIGLKEDNADVLVEYASEKVISVIPDYGIKPNLLGTLISEDEKKPKQTQARQWVGLTHVG